MSDEASVSAVLPAEIVVVLFPDGNG